MKILNYLNSLNTKSGKAGLSLFAIFIIYLVLFVMKSEDYTFGIVGGYVGAISAAIVIMDIYYQAYRGGAFRLLFWRACCDLGIALRFILIPAFDGYICGANDCDREQGDESRCGVPGALLEFFLLASEAWFLCSGIELIYSVTNPFSRFEPRLKYYHLFSWLISLTITFLPFLVTENQQVYGWWYLSDEIDDQAFCWLKIQSENVLGTPMTLFFFLPLQFVYFVNLLALFIAFNRLRKGLNRSFLPRLKILVSSAIHVFVLVLYWLFFFSLYGWAFATRDNMTYNGGLFAILNFIFASKGFSSFLIWILTTDHKNLKNFNAVEEKVEDNVALREEVLSFATAGIRNTARAGPTLTPEHTVLVRKPQLSSGKDTAAITTIVTPYFFLRFMLGEAEELAAIETIVSSKRRSVDDNFSRTTVSSTPATMLSRVSTRLSQMPLHAHPPSQRLSQRATIVTNRSDSGPFKLSAHRPFETEIDEEEQRKREQQEQQEREEEEKRNQEAESDYNRRSSDMIDASEAFEGNRKRSWIYQQLSDLLAYVIMDNTEHVEFYEFQPYHFRRVRLKYGIADDVYISAFSTTIKERLTEGGASGAFFFYSKGEKLIAKSCTESEFNVLTSIAASYSEYIDANPRSYISKILGAYKLRIYGTSLHFFVMNNLFYNKEMLTMNEKYDIKGSWYARNATPPVDGQSVTCSFCEQKFIYRKTRKGFTRPQIESTSLHRSESHSSVSNGSGLSNQARSLLESAAIPDNSTTNSNNSVNTSSNVNGEETTTLSPLTSSQQNINNTPSSSSTLPPIPRTASSAVFTKSKFFQTSSSALGGGGGGSGSGLKEGQCPYTVNGQHSPNMILKDNDIKYKIRLPPTTSTELLKQIKADADFLYRMNMMDYSLLVGVHNTEYDVHEMKRMRSKSRFTTVSQQSSSSFAVPNYPNNSLTSPPLPPPRPSSGLGIPSGAISASVLGEEVGTGGAAGGALGLRGSNETETYSEVSSVNTINPNKIEVMRVIGPDSYFIGIIDFQQRWTWSKKLERWFKINFHGADPAGLSAIEPPKYKDRFIRKVEDILDLEEANRLRRSSQTSEGEGEDGEDSSHSPMAAAILEAEERFTSTSSLSLYSSASSPTPHKKTHSVAAPTSPSFQRLELETTNQQ